MHSKAGTAATSQLTQTHIQLPLRRQTARNATHGVLLAEWSVHRDGGMHNVDTK